MSIHNEQVVSPFGASPEVDSLDKVPDLNLQDLGVWNRQLEGMAERSNSSLRLNPQRMRQLQTNFGLGCLLLTVAVVGVFFALHRTGSSSPIIDKGIISGTAIVAFLGVADAFRKVDSVKKQAIVDDQTVKRVRTIQQTIKEQPFADFLKTHRIPVDIPVDFQTMDRLVALSQEQRPDAGPEAFHLVITYRVPEVNLVGKGGGVQLPAITERIALADLDQWDQQIDRIANEQPRDTGLLRERITHWKLGYSIACLLLAGVAMAAFLSLPKFDLSSEVCKGVAMGAGALVLAGGMTTFLRVRSLEKQRALAQQENKVIRQVRNSNAAVKQAIKEEGFFDNANRYSFDTSFLGAYEVPLHIPIDFATLTQLVKHYRKVEANEASAEKAGESEARQKQYEQENDAVGQQAVEAVWKNCC